ncbi:MAG: hypothetical protein HY319_19880 [Armatimonadetes bacterium]|nr:hypothetical protein [Armatimonadota bacterium]
MAIVSQMGATAPMRAASGTARSGQTEEGIRDGYAGSVPTAEEIYQDHPAAKAGTAGIPVRLDDDALLYIAIGVAIGCICCSSR